SLADDANTSTVAPDADRSSAFHAAPADPPATRARLPSSAKNRGSRASGSMRGGRSSDGLRGSFMADDPSQVGQARAAVRAGLQQLTDGVGVGGGAAGDGIADSGQADAEAGADERAGVLCAVRLTARQNGTP